MDILKPIRSEKDYELALQKLEKFFDAKKGTAENDVADILVTLIDESEYYQIDVPDPIEAIKIRMEEMDLRQKDFMEVIDTKSRGTISNILKKRRPFTLPLTRAIGFKLGFRMKFWYPNTSYNIDLVAESPESFTW